jgi:peptide chain release factor 1
VHTSTVTVAVLPEPDGSALRIDPRDIEWSTCRGSGAGGQHRNKTESAVQLKHVPTGIVVRCESERSQHQNRATALTTLRARLWQDLQDKARDGRNADRKSQVGSGMRGDKIRTYRTQDDSVTDHRTGKRTSLKDVMRGILDGLK